MFFGFPGELGFNLYRSLHEASHAARLEARDTGRPVTVNRYLTVRLTRPALLDILNSQGGRWVAACQPVHTIRPTDEAVKQARSS
jgi:hypothetical protein